MRDINQIELKIIKKNIIVILSVISLFAAIIPIISNKTIVKEIKESKLKPLDQEGKSYRLVTSADNVQVPVPKGYVASNITGENYVTPEYSHTTVTHKVSTTPSLLTWSSPEGEQYPWTQDENGIWISGNQGIPDSESVLESEEFEYVKGTTVSIKYTYSKANGEYINIDVINLTNNTTTKIVYYTYAGNTSSSFDYTTSNYTYTMNNWATGRYKIRAIYGKNSSGDEGQDSFYIKPTTYFKKDENGTEIEEDIKTKIHDGGFVIYQLTDEEVEADPNGINININDTNKEIAQSERNQYVWVPVPNIEDVMRTKTENNGTLLFGQDYRLGNESICKITGTESFYYTEPRLENVDKTKYFLQIYSNQNERENFLKNMQEDYVKMVESINKYKGFYIGRYETGDKFTHNENKKCFTKPKIVRYNKNTNNVTWYNSYKELERLSGKTKKYVETGMLYNNLFDYTLIWLIETDTRSYKDITVDSGTWGCYMNISFKYKNSENGTEYTKSVNNTIMSPTGGITEITYNGEKYGSSPTASNNIFDIAGGVGEWTRSLGDTINRKNRTSSYGSNSNTSPAWSNSSSTPTNVNWYNGVRAQLYIL